MIFVVLCFKNPPVPLAGFIHMGEKISHEQNLQISIGYLKLSDKILGGHFQGRFICQRVSARVEYSLTI